MIFWFQWLSIVTTSIGYSIGEGGGFSFKESA